jgi:hypothetical protein
VELKRTSQVDTGRINAALNVDAVQPPNAPAAKKLGVGMGGTEHKQAIGQVETEKRQTGAIDQTVGVHFQKVLFGQTLADVAANPKHLRKMEESAQVIGYLERLPGRLGSIATFKPNQAFKLYEYAFPNPDEREPTQDIKDRLKTYDKGANADGSGFFSLAIADKDRHVIGYTQGSTVPSDRGLFFYWQYGCVADQEFMKKSYGVDSNPREHGILNTIHGANAATLVATAKESKQPALGMIWESEPRGLGEDAESIQFTGKRLQIHNQAGGRVMMGMTAEGELVNLHLQPRLTADSEPIALHMMFRPLKYAEGDEMKRGEMPKADGESMLLAWVDNFRREGFAEKDVAEAEAEIRSRLARTEKIVLLPANEVPDAVTLAKTDELLKKQLLDMYDVKDLGAARKFYDQAMKAAV